MTAAVIVGRALDAGTAVGYHDPWSGHDVLVTTPAGDPRRWEEFLAGAEQSYRTYGVEHALHLEGIRDGRSTALLFVMLSPEGEVVGGIRTQGPYTSVDESHAVHEWAGDPREGVVRSMIERRLPFGVVEMKGAWLRPGVPSRRHLVACLARTPIHAAALLGARYTTGTAAAHTVSAWVTAGGRVAHEVSPVSYPDERYSTSLMWFDRTDLALEVDGPERIALDAETAQLQAPVLPSQAARR